MNNEVDFHKEHRDLAQRIKDVRDEAGLAKFSDDVIATRQATAALKFFAEKLGVEIGNDWGWVMARILHLQEDVMKEFLKTHFALGEEIMVRDDHTEIKCVVRPTFTNRNGKPDWFNASARELDLRRFLGMRPMTEDELRAQAIAHNLPVEMENES